MDVSIQILQEEDLEEARNFWQEVIADTARKENIANVRKLVEDELRRILSNIDSSLKGEPECYFIARLDQLMIGSIAIGQPNDLIRTHMDLDAVPEIKSVYVHPDYQGKGIGRMLFQSVLMDLRRCGAKQFCLDCGYRRAQVFWQQLLGPPSLLLQAYWGEGSDHMIWLQDIEEK